MRPKNFLDAQNDPIPKKLRTSVCIIGAGAAGITVTRNLTGISDIILIESGDFEMQGRTQGLYAGSNLGLPYFDLLTCRLRYFGGTTNHWGGYCRANDPIDYEGRKSIGVPAWPIGHQELKPYIEKAAYELGISPEFFELATFFKSRGVSPESLLENKSPDFSTKVFQISSRVRFSQIYRDELAKQDNLRILLNLNAIHIQLSPNADRVIAIKCKALDGEEISIESDVFILACHAIENARLLLNSNDVLKNGVGNEYDHVGRYFMEHIKISASKFIPSDKFPGIYNRNTMAKMNLNANLGFQDDYLRRTDILQYYCRFNPVYTEDFVVDALRRLNNNIMRPFSFDLIDDLKVVMSDLEGSIDLSLAKYGTAQPVPKYYELEHRIEQAPNPDSRILLSANRDGLGMRKADLQWKFSELDYRTFKKGHEKIVNELSSLGLGRFIAEEITPELVDTRAKGHFHHIGTTKMSEDPRHGVVDADCKVHGLNNLYVIGSSVFPTAGYSGPTMMIIAFAMRLAETLSSKMRC